MFENALTMRGLSHGTKITYKTLVSIGLIALAVILPQLVHLALGQPGGVKWLPMYLPVLIGGCLLGTEWGLAIGILTPVVSFLITSAMGNPMPMSARLPFMILELVVFAAISGLFTKKISENGLWAFPAVILDLFAVRIACESPRITRHMRKEIGLVELRQQDVCFALDDCAFQLQILNRNSRIAAVNRDCDLFGIACNLILFRDNKSVLRDID